MRSFSEKTMSSNADITLARFARRFLESSGAVIEERPEGLDALLPDHLASRLNTPEYFHIATGKDAEDTEETFTIQYGSPFLERIVDAACSNAPLIACHLNFNYIKRQGFDRLIRDQFIFHNAVGRVQNTADVRTEYLLLSCKYLAQSDEQKEGPVALAFNLETGASVSEMDSMLGPVEKTFEANSDHTSLGDDKVKTVLKWVQGQAGRILQREIESFQDSMNRRFRRDVTNLDEYYEDLEKEMEKGLKRPGLSAQLVADRKEKIGLIPDELRRKKEDLFKKYSIRVELELCGGIWIHTPAVKILYQISFGKKQRQLSMIFNPVTKSMDPLVCEGCGDSTYTIGFCDHLHKLCPACRANCPVCRN